MQLLDPLLAVDGPNQGSSDRKDYQHPKRQTIRCDHTLHQSIKGLPRCGVAIVVSDSGVYSTGLRCVIR
jgi:hypothetical protein